jgi:hypothetical protein
MLNYEVNDNISMKSNFREIVILSTLSSSFKEIPEENHVISLHSKRHDSSNPNDNRYGDV